MIRRSVSVLLAVIVFAYAALLLMNMGHEVPTSSGDFDPARHESVAVFGATGTVGDGLLKAAINDRDVKSIHVVTRRSSPRIEQGVASGKVTMTIHMDYLDYTAIREILAEVDTVFWAIGLSAVGLDEETYREIHVTFPVKLVSEWLSVNEGKDVAFHYISGAGANADSRMMWARVKAGAETALRDLARDSSLRVILYRPSFVAPTDAEANFAHRILHAILAPINAAVMAESVGYAMLEVGARGSQIENGTILENKDIAAFSIAYGARLLSGVRADLERNRVPE